MPPRRPKRRSAAASARARGARCSSKRRAMTTPSPASGSSRAGWPTGSSSSVSVPIPRRRPLGRASPRSTHPAISRRSSPRCALSRPQSRGVELPSDPPPETSSSSARSRCWSRVVASTPSPDTARHFASKRAARADRTPRSHAKSTSGSSSSGLSASSSRGSSRRGLCRPRPPGGCWTSIPVTPTSSSFRRRSRTAWVAGALSRASCYLGAGGRSPPILARAGSSRANDCYERCAPPSSTATGAHDLKHRRWSMCRTPIFRVSPRLRSARPVPDTACAGSRTSATRSPRPRPAARARPRSATSIATFRSSETTGSPTRSPLKTRCAPACATR